MSALTEYKEKILSQWHEIYGKITESSSFNQLRDKYEDLSPLQQRGLLTGIFFLCFIFVLYFPYSALMTSFEFEESFIHHRTLIRDMLSVTKESMEAPKISRPSPLDQIQQNIESKIKSYGLLPEQMGSIHITDGVSSLFPRIHSNGGLIVQLKKLNLRQAIDISNSIQNIDNPQSVKLKDLRLEANREDPRYLDMNLSLVTFKVPEIPLPPVEVEPKKGARGSGSKPELKNKDSQSDE